MRHLLFAAGLALSLALLVAQTATASHGVLSAGSGTLKGTWHVDFDSGAFNTTVSSSEDLKFEVEGSVNSKRFLQTDSGATFAKMGMTRPSYATCFGTLLHSGQYALSTVKVGSWFCMRTNAGHLARFRLDQKRPYPGGVDLTFTTWT